jgi:hypothetical protein
MLSSSVSRMNMLLLNYLLALKAGLQRVDFLKFFITEDYDTIFLKNIERRDELNSGTGDMHI